MSYLDKHIWEGWTVRDFINDLDVIIGYQTFKDRKELKAWCMDNQPYYKKYIPEVVNHYATKLNLK
jgi:hypothetical protein